jgi:hypothetical protein
MKKDQMPPPPYIYGPMIQRVVEAGGYGKLKGMIWYEGESDALEGPAVSNAYEGCLLNFVDGVRKDTGNPDLPILVVQLSRDVTSYFALAWDCAIVNLHEDHARPTR